MYKMHGLYDVVIAGGGTSGSIAAIAAARTGAKTLLIEKFGDIGGLLNTGMGFKGVTDGEGYQALGGIPEDLIRRLRDQGGITDFSLDPMHGSITQFDPELLRYTLLEMSLEAGVNFLFHAFISDVLMLGNVVKGVVVQTKSGLEIIPAKVVVDATGDADVAAFAGAPFVKGRAEDGKMQPVTRMFRVTNVDLDRLFKYLEENPDEMGVPEGWSGKGWTPEHMWNTPGFNFEGFTKIIAKARAAGDYTIKRDRIGMDTFRGRNEVTINVTRTHDIDGTNSEDLSKAEVELQKQVIEAYRVLVKYVPGYENAKLANSAFQVGVRETRHIVGEYNLTREDILNSSEFTDKIGRGAYPMDIHDPSSNSVVLNKKVGGGGVTLWVIQKSYTVPYRCLVPQSIDGLLVTGRCASITHEAAGSARGQAVCMVMGHAAGTAAALAAKESLEPRDLPVDLLQNTLLDQGAILERDKKVLPI